MNSRYYIVCKDCKVKRDLNEMDIAEAHTEKEASSLACRISPYRSALLVSFLKEHQYHNCMLFPSNPVMEYRDDHEFWGEETKL